MHPLSFEANGVAVTLTIKQVPDRLAEGLRRRAAVNRRSQQQELILMLEHAIYGGATAGVGEPVYAVYKAAASERSKAPRKTQSGRSGALQHPQGKLGLDALWRRARKLGAGMPAESSAIVRADRDAGRR